MNTRHLFLVGYDICNKPRRRHVLRGVQHHALGGQKSFYECWLSVGELQTLMAQLRSCIDRESDRVIFVRLDPRSQSLQLGQGQALPNADYFYIG